MNAQPEKIRLDQLLVERTQVIARAAQQVLIHGHDVGLVVHLRAPLDQIADIGFVVDDENTSDFLTDWSVERNPAITTNAFKVLTSDATMAADRLKCRN